MLNVKIPYSDKILMKRLAPSFYLYLFFALLILSSCSTPLNTIVQGDRKLSVSRSIADDNLESVLADINSQFSSLSPDRKSELKILKENLIKYMLEAINTDDAYKIKIYYRAKTYLNKVFPIILKNIDSEVTGGKEFIIIRKAPLWTLKDELEFLDKEAEAYPKSIYDLDLIQGIKIIDYFNKKFSSEIMQKNIKKIYNKSLNKLSTEALAMVPQYEEVYALTHMDGSDQDKILSFFKLFESKTGKFENDLRHIGDKISASGQMDTPELKLIVHFMNFYFQNLSDDVIKTIMSEIVSSGVGPSEEKIMTILFQNTGPGLGKVLQQIGKEKGVGEHFSKLMSVLESSGKSVPYHLVQKIVNEDEGGFEIKSISEKAVGTGTIAQVNRAELIRDGEKFEVALRFLKPGVTARCKEDIAILKKYIPANAELLHAQGIEDLTIMETLIDSVEKFLDEEVDLGIAVERQQKAYEVYSKAIRLEGRATKYRFMNIAVPKVYIPSTGKSHLHVQEFMSGGVKFSDLTDRQTQKIVAEEMLELWFEEALFKSGFLNADLHQGNFRVVLIDDTPSIKIILYDFGLSTTLTSSDQRSFMLVGAGAQLKSPGIIAEGLMASMSSNDPKLKQKILNNIKLEIKANPNFTAEEWIAWCVQKNYFVSDNLGAFARGSLLLKQLPESIGSVDMFNEVIKKTTIRHLKQLTKRKSEYDFPLTNRDMVRVAKDGIKGACKQMIKSFFKR
jgi:hypothetical protein